MIISTPGKASTYCLYPLLHCSHLQMLPTPSLPRSCWGSPRKPHSAAPGMYVTIPAVRFPQWHILSDKPFCHLLIYPLLWPHQCTHWSLDPPHHHFSFLPHVLLESQVPKKKRCANHCSHASRSYLLFELGIAQFRPQAYPPSHKFLLYLAENLHLCLHHWRVLGAGLVKGLKSHVPLHVTFPLCHKLPHSFPCCKMYIFHTRCGHTWWCTCHPHAFARLLLLANLALCTSFFSNIFTGPLSCFAMNSRAWNWILLWDQFGCLIQDFGLMPFFNGPCHQLCF